MNSKFCGTVTPISRPACLKAAATFLAAGTSTPLYCPSCQLPSGSLPTHTQATISLNGLIAATNGRVLPLASSASSSLVHPTASVSFLACAAFMKARSPPWWENVLADATGKPAICVAARVGSMGIL